MLCAGGTAVNETDRNPCPRGADGLVGETDENKTAEWRTACRLSASLISPEWSPGTGAQLIVRERCLRLPGLIGRETSWRRFPLSSSDHFSGISQFGWARTLMQSRRASPSTCSGQVPIMAPAGLTGHSPLLFFSVASLGRSNQPPPVVWFYFLDSSFKKPILCQCHLILTDLCVSCSAAREWVMGGEHEEGSVESPVWSWSLRLAYLPTNPSLFPKQNDQFAHLFLKGAWLSWAVFFLWLWDVDNTFSSQVSSKPPVCSHCLVTFGMFSSLAKGWIPCS